MSRCNYDTLSSNWSSNVANMHRGSTDEAVVVVKLNAEDRYGDIPEDKTFKKCRKVKAKGGTC